MTDRAKVVVLDGRRWVILPERDYLRLRVMAEVESTHLLPKLPVPDGEDEISARVFGRVSLARKIIRRRRAAGLTQVELSRRAGVRPETLNRVEKGRTTPSVATIAKLERALESARAEAREEEEEEGE